MKNINILIDATEISKERQFASIPIYIMRFLSCIPFEQKKNFYLLIKKESQDFFQENFPDFKLVVCDVSLLYKVRINHIRFLWHSILKYKLNSIIKQYDIDIFFVPTDFQSLTMFKINCKKVIVIHDLKALKKNVLNIHDIYIKYNINRMYYKAINTSNKIIAISKYTKQDILCLYPQVQEKKVQVIYNAVQLPTNEIKPFNFNCKKYILYVNTLQEYKNIFTLIKAFKRILEKTDRSLVIVGKKTYYWNKIVVPYIEEYNFSNRIIILNNLSEEELKYIYTHADLFVSTSLHEGFGYTPIEAAICKCPVLVSIQEALPDVTEGLVNYYYPAMDDVILSQSILRIINNPIDEDRLSKLSEYYKKKYSPYEQYNNIMELFYDLCKDNNKS